MRDMPARPSGGANRPSKRVNLVSRVVEELRREIVSGALHVGTKLPSEAALTAEHKVSRTVIREAMAWLRADGLVEARQGAGVYITAPKPVAGHPFRNVEKISSVIELLELRTAVEVEAAGLASRRRSPAQEEAIIERCQDIDGLIEAGADTADADFVLHLSIADATNNSRFRECLELLGGRMIPRSMLQEESAEQTPFEYLRQLQSEHRRIAEAISIQDEVAARAAMRAHLEGSQARYRQFLRRA